MLGSRYALTNKVALVTGAGQGIGLALATELRHRGAQVALLDSDPDACAQAVATLGTDRALAVPADVTDRAGMAEAVEIVVERFGRLDVVVANAGVAPKPATLRTMDPGEFDRVLGINLTGVFNTVQAATDAIVTNRGHITIVSSAAAFAPGPAGSPYMISKAGVEQLGRALRLELAPHRTSVELAYFGIVDTSMTTGVLSNPLGRRVERMLPWPLRHRITAEHAAQVMADGIERRASRVLVPRVWQPYALLRGLVNPLIDGLATRDPRVRRLVRDLEQRHTT